MLLPLLMGIALVLGFCLSSFIQASSNKLAHSKGFLRKKFSCWSLLLVIFFPTTDVSSLEN